MRLRSIEDEAQFIRFMRNRRIGLRWSQAELARRLEAAGLDGFNQTNVSRLEQGERPLRLNEARVIAEVLDSELQALADRPTISGVPAGESKNSDLLTLQEVSDWLRIPVATLRYWRHMGTGPKSANLGGRRVRYRRSDVLAWVEGQFEAE